MVPSSPLIKTPVRDNFSKITIPTIKHSMTRFPVPKEEPRFPKADIHKSQMLAKSPAKKTGKEIRSAIFDSKLMGEKFNRLSSLDLKCKLPERQGSLNSSGEIRSLNTFSHSLYNPQGQKQKTWGSPNIFLNVPKGQVGETSRSIKSGKPPSKVSDFSSNHYQSKKKDFIQTFVNWVPGKQVPLSRFEDRDPHVKNRQYSYDGSKNIAAFKKEERFVYGESADVSQPPVYRNFQPARSHSREIYFPKSKTPDKSTSHFTIHMVYKIHLLFAKKSQTDSTMSLH